MDTFSEVEAVIGMSGLVYESKTHLKSGSSSDVWMVQTSTGRVIVRFLDSKNGIDPRIGFEATVRGKLYEDGVRVAQPIANSLQFSDEVHSKSWIIDEFISGQTYPRGQIPDGVCASLAQVLAHVHGIEGKGFGLPIEGSELQGSTPCIEAGLESRFDNPWPFGSLTLQQHPICAADKPLLEQLAQLENEVRQQVRESRSCLVHSDLHERQLICKHADLAALIDFGDSMFADPAWDFASFYYFHGERALWSLLENYEPREITRSELFLRSRLFSVCIACHHAMRSTRLDRPHRLEAAIGHLERILM